MLIFHSILPLAMKLAPGWVLGNVPRDPAYLGAVHAACGGQHMSEPVPAFDGRHPPIDPPAECVNPLVWRLSRRLFADHQPGPDGWCLLCRPAITYPCVARQLADRGLIFAMTGRDPVTDRGSRGGNWGHRW